MTASPVAAVLTACLSAAAVLLVTRPRARVPHESGEGPGYRRRSSVLTAGAAVSAAALGVLLEGLELVLLAIGVVAAFAVAALWRRRRSQRLREAVQSAVVELGEALVGELRAGQPVIEALQRGSHVWTPFAPVAAAARLGADVPAALSRVAAQPGAEGVERLASAWRVSQRTGCSLAGVLDQVAVSGRDELASTRLVRAELASAQATARLVALLPAVTLAMASGSGGDPWTFLLHQPAGLACLAAGTALIFLGLWWIDRIADAASRS